MMKVQDVNRIWLNLLREVLTNGVDVAPRDMKTKEILGCYTIDASRTVLTVPERKINYRFMAAEPLWILAGRDDVASIAQYNSQMANYAPLGDRFFGAYGPRWQAQWVYLISKLIEDRDTRQAVVSLWTENPPKGVDVACNILLVFSIRGRQVNLTVSARSKDLWLGFPYDVFGFSMALHKVVCALNGVKVYDPPLLPGIITFFDSSLHLYEQHWEAARELLRYDEHPEPPFPRASIPASPATRGDWLFYETYLKDMRDVRGGGPLFEE